LPLIAVFFLTISVLIATYCCFYSLYFCLEVAIKTEIDRKKTAISGNQDRNREKENSNKWQSRQK
jgi:hypothetical protein